VGSEEIKWARKKASKWARKKLNGFLIKAK
jgi:hypothetical protein